MRPYLVLAAALLAAPAGASAQGYALPVVNNGVATGVSVAADVGFPNDELGGGTAFGAQAQVGLGLLGVGAQVVRHSPDELDATTSMGVSAALRVFGGPLVPFRVLLQGGYARWDVAIEPGIDAPYWRIPLSVGFAATIPVPAFAIKPWLAPRLEFYNQGGDAKNDFGVSGGIEVGFLNGLSLRAAYDRTFVEHDGGASARPSVLSVGLGWGF